MPSVLLRWVRRTKSARPIRRTSPPSRVPGRETYSSLRNLESASASEGASAAGVRSERQDHRQFVENDGRVFDKHGIGEAGLSRKRNEACAEFLQKRFVGAVLFLSGGEIDELAVNEGELAMNDGGAEGARHGEK